MIQIIRTLALFCTVCAAAYAQSEVTRTTVYTGGEDGYHTYRIPAMAVTNSGAILAFAEGRKTSRSDDGDIDLLLKRSTDGGRTWAPQQIVHEEGGDAPITIGNPCVIHDPQTNRVHLLFSRNNERAFYTCSDDEGATWQPPTEITGAIDGFDFPWSRLGTGPGHGLRLESGRLIVPIWLNERIGHNYRSAAIYSDDDGATWHAGGLAGPEVADTNECTIAELDDGRLCMNMRAQNNASRAVAFSTDGGESWTVPTLDDNLTGPVCQASLLAVPGYRHTVLFSHAAGPERANLTLRMSTDNGATWPQVVVLHNDLAAYSDLAVTRAARILCLAETGSDRQYQRIELFTLQVDEYLAEQRIARRYVIGNSIADAITPARD